MNRYRVGICDDEKYYQDEMVTLLSAFEDESGNHFDISTYPSGEALLEDYNSKVYHIIILDIEMSGLSGMDVARELRKHDDNVIIIFATSHESFALNAYDVLALGYLVKPVAYTKMKQYLSKAIIMIDFLKDQEAAKKRYLQVKVKYENVNIEINTILYIEKRRNKSIIHARDNEYTCYETLTQLYEKLDIHTFVYTHQGYLVNFNQIKEVSETSVFLEDYIEVPISRKYHKPIKDRFMNNVYKAMKNI
jgi:two-component system response regulator LytT